MFLQVGKAAEQVSKGVGQNHCSSWPMEWEQGIASELQEPEDKTFMKGLGDNEVRPKHL